MPSVQTSYTDRMARGQNGQVADGTPCVVRSYVLEGTENVEFATVVFRGSVPRYCDQTGGNANNYLGITVLDPTRYPGDLDRYVPGANVSVLSEGKVFVRAPVPVSWGQRAYFNPDTGALTDAGSVLYGAANTGLAALQLFNRNALTYAGTTLGTQPFTGFSLAEMAASIEAGINLSNISVGYDEETERFVVSSNSAAAVAAFTGGANDDFGLDATSANLVTNVELSDSVWEDTEAVGGIAGLYLGSTVRGA